MGLRLLGNCGFNVLGCVVCCLGWFWSLANRFCGFDFAFLFVRMDLVILVFVLVVCIDSAFWVGFRGVLGLVRARISVDFGFWVDFPFLEGFLGFCWFGV